jgi:hypothetical protein
MEGHLPQMLGVEQHKIASILQPVFNWQLQKLIFGKAVSTFRNWSGAVLHFLRNFTFWKRSDKILVTNKISRIVGIIIYPK